MVKMVTKLVHYLHLRYIGTYSEIGQLPAESVDVLGIGRKCHYPSGADIAFPQLTNPDLYVFGMWEGARVPGGSPYCKLLTDSSRN